MKGKLLKYLAICLSGLLLFTDCDVIETSSPEGKGSTADLRFSVNVPLIEVDTRTIASDPDNVSDEWTDWEKYVDGRMLYRVTIFVVDADDRLVAYRDFYGGSSDVDASSGNENGFWEADHVNPDAQTGIAVKATFLADAPMHGDVERLQAGRYTVMAVANYSPYAADGVSYAGLGASEDIVNGADGDFAGIVDGILADFNEDPANGITDFNADSYPEFFNYRLDAGSDMVCSMKPQPLVMIRAVDVQAGVENHLDGELSRTFARIRINVRNNSANLLSITDLSFEDSFASQHAYLFNDIYAADDVNLHGHFDLHALTKGKIDVTSEDAIVANRAKTDLFEGTEETIFDAYILEGQIGTSLYAYTFTATYKGTMEPGTGTNNIMLSDIRTVCGYYLFIRNSTRNSRNCIISDENTLAVGDIGSTGDNIRDIDPDFIWKVENLRNVTSLGNQAYSATCNARSCGTGLYLQPYDGSQDRTARLGSQPADLEIRMNCRGVDEFGTFLCEYNGKTYCINGSGEWTEYGNSYQILTYETLSADENVNIEGNYEYSIEQQVTSGYQDLGQAVRNDYYTANFSFSRKE